MPVFSKKLRLQRNSRDGPADSGDSKGDRGKEALNLELEPPEVQKHVTEFAKEFLDKYPHGPPSCPYKGKSKACKKVMKGIPGLLHGDGALGGDVISETGGGDSGGGSVEASPDKELKKMPGLREKMNLEQGNRGHEAKPPKEMGFKRNEADDYLDQEAELPIVDVDPEDIAVIEAVDEIAPGADEYEDAMEEGEEPMVEEDADDEDAILEVSDEDVEMYAEDDAEEAVEEVAEDAVEEMEEDDDRAHESCGDKEGRGREYAARDHEAADAEEVVEEVEEEPVEVPEEEVEPVSECPSGCVPAPTSEEVSEEEVVEDAVEEEGAKEAALEADLPEDIDDVTTVAGTEEADEKEEEQMIYETISPEKLAASADISDVALFLHGEDGENPHYVVLVDGDPVAKIALADQQISPEHSEMFLDDNYPQFVLEGIENFGLKETLNSVNAKYYAASALEGDIATQMRAAATDDMADLHKASMADLKDKLISTAAVVIEGSMKNYLTDNPLKDALVRQLGRVSVDENSAIDLVEDAWREAAVDYMTAMLDKAEEWLGAPEEVMAHHIKEITGASYRHPGYVQGDDDDIPMYEDPKAPVAEDFHVPVTAAAPTNVPIRTAAPSPSNEFVGDKDYWKRQMNLTGRHMQQSLANVKNRK